MESMIGKKFKRLLVIARFSINGKTTNRFICKCECFNYSIVTKTCLNGRTGSCGCLNRELMRNEKMTHNMTRTTSYNIWSSMKSRCYNQKNHKYKNYGARGIIVCESWRISFENFLSDMGQRPTKNHSIERINNNGPYSKENCRWATLREQHFNKTKTVLISYNGNQYTTEDIAKLTNSNAQNIGLRIRRGWPIEKLFQKV